MIQRKRTLSSALKIPSIFMFIYFVALHLLAIQTSEKLYTETKHFVWFGSATTLFDGHTNWIYSSIFCTVCVHVFVFVYLFEVKSGTISTFCVRNKTLRIQTKSAQKRIRIMQTGGNSTPAMR